MSTPIPAVRITTVTIPVADQERALAFYRDVLGFTVTADNAFGDQRWLSVAPAGSPVDFTLHPPFPGRGEQGGGEAGWQQGLVLQTDDIESVVAGLRSAGVEIADPEHVGWGVQSQFRDPDGNGFVLLQQGRPAGLRDESDAGAAGDAGDAGDEG